MTALGAFPAQPKPRILLMDFPKQGVPARVRSNAQSHCGAQAHTENRLLTRTVYSHRLQELVRYGWRDFDPSFKAQLLELKRLMLTRVHVKRFSSGPIEGECTRLILCCVGSACPCALV